MKHSEARRPGHGLSILYARELIEACDDNRIFSQHESARTRQSLRRDPLSRAPDRRIRQAQSPEANVESFEQALRAGEDALSAQHA
jgi:hypothetical protein